jgi:hypothetical protein
MTRICRRRRRLSLALLRTFQSRDSLQRLVEALLLKSSSFIITAFLFKSFG